MLSLVGKAPPAPMSGDGLKEFIRQALRKGWVRESFHSEVERADRNITHTDVVFGLESDWKLFSARFSDDHGTYTYCLETKDLDDEELHIVICPNLRDRTLTIVTKY
jgi:hypothetical protein